MGIELTELDTLALQYIESSQVSPCFVSCTLHVQRGELQARRIDDTIPDECLRLARATTWVRRVDEATTPCEKLTEVRTGTSQPLSKTVARDAENLGGDDILQLQDLSEHEAHALISIQAQQHS